ncbi:hypothetical protein D3C81_1584190 [compost metagenome]
MFNDDAIKEWEESIHKSNEKRIFKTSKNLLDPRMKKLNEYRHHRVTKYWYRHESKYVRKLTQRRFRRKHNKTIELEEYYKLIPHDYKTYGWITW